MYPLTTLSFLFIFVLNIESILVVKPYQVPQNKR